MKVTPNAHIVRALCAQNLTHQKALCEWIDNALDAGAMAVSVVFGGSFVSVEDNGCGTADLAPFATLGESERHRSTKSGMYGIGSKDAALWYGGERCVQTVESHHGGMRRTLRIDWLHMANHDWEIDDPTESSAAIPRTGTLIRVEPYTRNVPHGADWKRLADELGYIYSSAIKRGVSITLRARRGPPEPLAAWKLPPLIVDSLIDDKIEIGGKHARVYAGLVEDGHENTRPGLTYHHGFRVIVPASGRGCGDGEWRRVAGFVEIDNAWTRTKNKDDIRHAEDLYAAVQQRLAPLLDRADRSGMELRSSAFTQAISDRINAGLRAGSPDAKAIREARTSASGAVTPKATGRKHKRAAREQGGATFGGSRSSGAVRIAWAPHSDGKIGKILGNTIELNEALPFIAHIKATSNADATALLVFSLIAADQCLTGGKPQLALRNMGGADVDFFAVLGGVCSRPGALDGRALAVVEAA